jgi:uncharacterized protein (DUF3084 family)
MKIAQSNTKIAHANMKIARLEWKRHTYETQTKKLEQEKDSADDSWQPVRVHEGED